LEAPEPELQKKHPVLVSQKWLNQNYKKLSASLIGWTRITEEVFSVLKVAEPEIQKPDWLNQNDRKSIHCLWLDEPEFQKKHLASLIGWTRITKKASGVLEVVEPEFQKKHRRFGSGRARITKKVSGILEGAEPELQKTQPESWKHFDCLPKEYTGHHESLWTRSGWTRITKKASGILEGVEPELQKKKRLDQNYKKCIRCLESILIAHQKNKQDITEASEPELQPKRNSTTRPLASWKHYVQDSWEAYCPRNVQSFLEVLEQNWMKEHQACCKPSEAAPKWLYKVLCKRMYK
jgi:hypothetical protein